MASLSTQIKKENDRFDLIDQCTQLFYSTLQESEKLRYFPYNFKFLFQNKGINELKKYIKTSNKLKQIQDGIK